MKKGNTHTHIHTYAPPVREAHEKSNTEWKPFLRVLNSSTAVYHVAYLLFLAMAISFRDESLCILLDALKIGLELVAECLRLLERLLHLRQVEAYLGGS